MARMAGDRARAQLTAILLVAMPAAAQDPGVTSADAALTDGEKRVLRLEMTQRTTHCRAEATVEYLQHDTLASVGGVIKSDDCESAGGDYTIAVRIRDADGALQNLEYVEAWQADGGNDFRFTRDYDIGPDVDLVRVRVSKVECICNDAAAGDMQPPNTGEDNE